MNKKSWMVLRIVAGLYLVFLWGSDHFPGDQGAAEQSGADDMCRSFVYWSGGCICRCCDQQRMEDEQGRRKISGG